MQEEIEHKTVNLAISTTKLSARTLLRGMQFLLRQYDKHASQGKQSMKRLVVNDKVQRENINSINYFRDDKLVQQAISDTEELMAVRQKNKEQERGSTKKSVLEALHGLKAKKQEQPEQDKPKKAKKKGMEL